MKILFSYSFGKLYLMVIFTSFNVFVKFYAYDVKPK